MHLALLLALAAPPAPTGAGQVPREQLECLTFELPKGWQREAPVATENGGTAALSGGSDESVSPGTTCLADRDRFKGVPCLPDGLGGLACGVIIS